MTIWEKLLLVASIVGALITIGTAGYKYLYKPLHDFLGQFHQMQRYQQWCYHNTLRMMIISEEMPLEERIAAGDKYVNEEHLNGAVKQKYFLLQEKYRKQEEQNED